MSAGAHHKGGNLLVPGPKLIAILHKFLTEGDAPELMKRWQRLDMDCDIAYTAGYNTWGTTRFGDRDFVRALYDDDYARKILGSPIHTGMSPDDTLECVLWHEAVEKVILDADNPVELYDHHVSPGGFGAHEYATAAEHEKVKSKGGTPYRYENGLAPIIAFCNKKTINKISRDYACSPYLDDPDDNEKRIIKELQAHGVIDAFKSSKESVKYSTSTGEDRCDKCKHWMNQFGGPGISLCELIAGMVRDDRWCTKFEEGTYEEQPAPAPEQEKAPEIPAPPAAQASTPASTPPPPPQPESAAPSPAPTQPHPDIAALADSVAQIAGAVHHLVNKKSHRKKRTITATRDQHGNLIASVEDAPEDNE